MKKYRRYWSLVPSYLAVLGLIFALTVSGSRAVTTYAQIQRAKMQTCVVIDPGHGGEDGGAISCTGIPESKINLEIAAKLNDLLNLLGYQTKMIRTTDISVYTEGESLAAKKISDLKHRAAMVNEIPNALLISVHQNHFPDSRYSGAQVFYGKDAASSQLAENLQADFIKHLNPGSRRKAKACKNVYLMEKASCTAILVECGFLSNYEEEASLRTPEYQQKISCVIASGISRYLAST